MNPSRDRPPARADADAPRIGRYRVCYRIAQGGMGSVYLARLDAAGGFSKWVALKVIHPNIASEPRFREMFLDEARIAARLDHPNLCMVFDFGEDDGRYYLAMEYLHGESLGHVARRAWGAQGALPRELGARLVADAARGLHFAHELKADDGGNAHVVHRDISPENIFVTYSGSAKVVDFGVARSDDQLHEQTSAGELKGKLAYMSPEQLHERRIDRRTDLWALGVVLWEVTVGRRLFRRSSDAATVFAITRDPITPPSRLIPDYPGDLEAIVMRALERDLAKRYQTAHELCRALEAWLVTSGRPAGTTEVGDFMQALFSEQIDWRDRHLRAGDATFRDLVSTWSSPPPHAGPPDDPVVPAITLGPSAPPVVPRPAPPRTTPEPPPPPAPASDDLDVTLPLRGGGESFAIPLTRRSSVPPGRVFVRRTATPAPIEDHALTVPRLPIDMPRLPTDAPRLAPPRSPRPPPTTPVIVLAPPTPAPAPAPYVAPPRRRRWDVPLYLLGLMALGALFAHIAWFDRPIPRRARLRGSSRATVHPLVAATPLALTPAPATPAAPAAPAAPTTPAAPAAPATPTTPEPADRGIPGLLRVRANVPAEVFVGSRSLGYAPVLDAPLAPGVHSVRVVSSARPVTREFTVTIRPRRTVTLAAEWSDGPAPPP